MEEGKQEQEQQQPSCYHEAQLLERNRAKAGRETVGQRSLSEPLGEAGSERHFRRGWLEGATTDLCSRPVVTAF